MTAKRVLAALALTALTAVAAQTALGQLPIRPAATETATKPATPEPIEQQRARLRAQLDRARADSARLADPAAAGAPAGLTQQELATARNALSQLVLAIDGQLRALEEGQTTRTAREEAEKSGRDWSGFASPPPYSILLLDELTEAVGSIKTRISALTAQRAIADAAVERAGRDTQRSEAALRLAREPTPVGQADDPTQQQWRVQVAEWAAAASAAQLALFRRSQEVVDEQIALEGERLKLAERKREIAARDARFTDEDLAQVRRNQDERRERIRAQRTKATEYRDRQERELAAAAEALRKIEADPAAPAEAASIARARLRASQAAVEAAKFELDTLDSLTAVANATVDLYARRHQALNDSDAGHRRDAVLWLREAGARIKPWRDYAQSQLDLLRAEERQSDAHSAHEDDPPQAQAYENAVAEAIRQRVGHAQRLFDAADRAQRTVTRWLAEIDSAQQERPWHERMAGAWATVSDWARQIWNFELFAVEDTIDVGGQKITTSRGVTIGKSVGALLLFILGYWVAALLARRFERFLIGRFAMEPAQARTVRRWVLALWAFVLLVLTLNLARIPLTVFAFLGGALAIGVGFGTQTIIRNFISGLIVLMERQVRVGDTIEVDGVTGTVTEVNLRSSTVRGFDGVEAIIPNSNLLENKVTNWTHTDKRVRRIVRIGVAYGSPVRQVADLLGECLQRHGLVLKDPEPQVLFEDFGDNALVFAMYFWLEMKPGVNSMQVMSDLRFMVHKRLDEEGIAVPFPQRDVHFDAARPLQVQVIRGRPAAES